MGNCCELELEQTAAAATAAADGMSKSPAKITKDTNKTNASTTARVSLNRDSIGTIHENITITDHTKYEDRNVFDYYDKVKVIGWGSTCTIYKVRKKKVRKKKKKKKHESSTTTCATTYGAEKPETKSHKWLVLPTVGLRSQKKINTNGSRDDRVFALKEISKERVDDLFLQEVRNEVAILRTLDHPNIVRVYDIFETKRAFYLVMEYCKGKDLYARVPYTEAQVAKIMTKLLSAIVYCHQRKIVHRDLKMENVMFESKCPDAEIKLIDFGLSKMYLKPSKSLEMKDIVGTVYTMSPQVIKKKYTEKADVWACGCIAFILLSNKLPFGGKSRKEVSENIVKYQWNKDFEGPEWANVSSDAKKFVSSLLVYDEVDRKSAAQALHSSWLWKTFALESRRPEDEVMNDVTNALLHSANDGKFKRLAMQVVAYNSPTAEIQRLRSAFDAFDTNNAGTITYLEFQQALSQSNFSEKDMKTMFESIDVNSTGVINYTEFIAATLETRGLIEEERILAAFDKLDSDNSGYISKENLCSILGDKCSDKDCDSTVKELIEGVDTDGDGKISYGEFLVLFRERKKGSTKSDGCSPPNESAAGAAFRCAGGPQK